MVSVIDQLILESSMKNATSPTSSWGDEEEQEELHPSIPRPTDEWDYLGRNVSAMQRHQNLVPWVTVIRSRGPLSIESKHMLVDFFVGGGSFWS